MIIDLEKVENYRSKYNQKPTVLEAQIKLIENSRFPQLVSNLSLII